MANQADSAVPSQASRRASVEDVSQLDLRIGEVVTAERLRKSDHLLVVSVDLGSERRTLVAGVAKAYTPDELTGMKVVVAANIAPAMIRGVKSDGMLLGVGCQDPSAAALLTVTRPAANGASVV